MEGTTTQPMEVAVPEVPAPTPVVEAETVAPVAPVNPEPVPAPVTEAPVAAVVVEPVADKKPGEPEEKKEEKLEEPEEKKKEEKLEEPKKKKAKRLTLLEKDVEAKLVTERTIDLYVYLKLKKDLIANYFTWKKADVVVNKKTKKAVLAATQFYDCELLVDFDDKLKAGTKVHSIIFRGDIMNFFVFPTATSGEGSVFEIPVTTLPLKPVNIFETIPMH